jgi:predicted DNA-binding transcriptional regulator YafY
MDDEPVEVVLDAIERGTDVFIVYAGARGTTQRQITPYEVEGAAVHAYCHLRADERSFWLASILDAVPVRG